MLNIYYGGEHTDREKFIFEKIKGKTILIVPDQFSLQAERDAFFYLGKDCLIDVRVMDFSTLGHKTVRQVGGKIPKLIDKYGRHMLLTKVMNRKDRELSIYRGMNWKNSFIEMLNSMISEMKRYDVFPEDLRRAEENLGSGSYLKYKLKDIISVYEAYQEEIKGKYLDSEDYISFYGEKILDAPMIKESEIWIYGFDTFTPKNMMVIQRLIKSSRGVNIVMTYEKEKEIFDLTKHVIGQLSDTASDIGEEVLIRAIEGYPRMTVWNRDKKSSAVIMTEASNMYAEADRAAAYILDMVRDEGYRFGDIVVVCNDMDTRGMILKRTFIRWGIPVFMDRKRKVMHHQAVGFVLALMEVASSGYRDSSMMKLIKSQIMGFDDNDKELFENYVKQFRIRGALWKKAFTKGDEQYGAENVKRLDGMREALVAVAETVKLRMGRRNTAGEKIQGLYKFLEDDMDMISRLENMIQIYEDKGFSESAAEMAQSWNVICGILDQITETIGSEKISSGELLKLMTAGFEEFEIGLVPVTSDCVLIGTLQRTRTSRLKVLLVTGANEGVLPLEHGEEGLLSRHEKDILQSFDLEFSNRDDIARQEERIAVYRMLCLPEERLYVSCCRTDSSGESIRPSEVFSRLKAHVEKTDSVSVFGDLGESGEVLDMVTSKKGTLSYMAEAFRHSLNGEKINEDWFIVRDWYEKKLGEDIGRLRRGMAFDNRLEALGERFADDLYRGDRNVLMVSASRLERYSSCPFAHFVMYGLRADEPRTYEVGAREIGDIYHRCLMKLSVDLTSAEISGNIDDADSKWMTLTREECDEKIREIIKNDALVYREGILVSGREEEYRSERIIEICSRIAWSMVQQIRKGRIRTMKFEYPFGEGRQLPAVKVKAGKHTVLINGKIDRMDIMRGPLDIIRIIDYKTGGDTIDPEYFSRGYKLQLMIYMRAVLEAYGKKAEPAGIFYFRIKDMDTDADIKAVDLSREGVEKRIADTYRLEGIVLNDEEVIRSMDSEIDGVSQVIPVKAAKKTGGYAPASGGHLMSADEFTELYDQVNIQIERICREIYDGKLDIRPKRERIKDREGRMKTACRYCDYKSICMFDTSFSGCRYEQI